MLLNEFSDKVANSVRQMWSAKIHGTSLLRISTQRSFHQIDTRHRWWSRKTGWILPSRLLRGGDIRDRSLPWIYSLRVSRPKTCINFSTNIRRSRKCHSNFGHSSWAHDSFRHDKVFFPATCVRMFDYLSLSADPSSGRD